MSDKEKDLIEETEEAKTEATAEEDDEIDAEDLGYQKHKFSLFDSAAEILLVIFIIGFVGYKVIDFFFLYPDGTDIETIFRYLFDLAVDVIPAICLIALLELHEKMDKLSYNLELNSEYMARYQGDLLERIDEAEDLILDELEEFDEEEETEE